MKPYHRGWVDNECGGGGPLGGGGGSYFFFELIIPGHWEYSGHDGDITKTWIDQSVTFISFSTPPFINELGMEAVRHAENNGQPQPPKPPQPKKKCSITDKLNAANKKAMKVFLRDMAIGEGVAFLAGCGITT